MGLHSFTCHPHANHYSPGESLLPSPKASPPFGWYSWRLPTRGWPGWVDPGGWSHIEINVPHRELNPDTVTHPSTNRARRRVTSFDVHNAVTANKPMSATPTRSIVTHHWDWDTISTWSQIHRQLAVRETQKEDGFWWAVVQCCWTDGILISIVVNNERPT